MAITIKVSSEPQQGPAGQFFAAEVTIGEETKTLKAYDYGDRFHVSGIAVRYQTGAKVWAGRLTYWKASGNIQVSGGLDNRARRKSLSVCGFYSDAAEAKKSRHNHERIA
jgi:hypothetical protein